MNNHSLFPPTFKLHQVATHRAYRIVWQELFRIQSEYGKIQTRKYSVFGHFSRSANEKSHVLRKNICRLKNLVALKEI